MFISTAYAAAPGTPFLESPDTWVAATFTILVLIAIRPLYRGFIMAMTIRKAKIKRKILSAKLLREETEKVLRNYKEKQKNVEEEILAIVENSKIQAEKLRQDSELKLKENLALREKQIMDNIALLEKSALAEINAKITDVTLNAVQSIIQETIDAKKDKSIVDSFVSEFPETLNKLN